MPATRGPRSSGRRQTADEVLHVKGVRRKLTERQISIVKTYGILTKNNKGEDAVPDEVLQNLARLMESCGRLRITQQSTAQAHALPVVGNANLVSQKVAPQQRGGARGQGRLPPRPARLEPEVKTTRSGRRVQANVDPRYTSNSAWRAPLCRGVAPPPDRKAAFARKAPQARSAAPQASQKPLPVALVSRPADVVTCPGGHKLQRLRVCDGFAQDCDRCGEHQPQGSYMESCRRCNYDICENCVEKAQDLQSSPQRTWPEPSQPTARGRPPRALVPSAVQPAARGSGRKARQGAFPPGVARRNAAPELSALRRGAGRRGSPRSGGGSPWHVATSDAEEEEAEEGDDGEVQAARVAARRRGRRRRDARSSSASPPAPSEESSEAPARRGRGRHAAEKAKDAPKQRQRRGGASPKGSPVTALRKRGRSPRAKAPAKEPRAKKPRTAAEVCNQSDGFDTLATNAARGARVISKEEDSEVVRRIKARFQHFTPVEVLAVKEFLKDELRGKDSIELGSLPPARQKALEAFVERLYKEMHKLDGSTASRSKRRVEGPPELPPNPPRPATSQPAPLRQQQRVGPGGSRQAEAGQRAAPHGPPQPECEQQPPQRLRPAPPEAAPQAAQASVVPAPLVPSGPAAAAPAAAEKLDPDELDRIYRRINPLLAAFTEEQMARICEFVKDDMPEQVGGRGNDAEQGRGNDTEQGRGNDAEQDDDDVVDLQLNNMLPDRVYALVAKVEEIAREPPVPAAVEPAPGAGPSEEPRPCRLPDRHIILPEGGDSMLDHCEEVLSMFDDD